MPKWSLSSQRLDEKTVFKLSGKGWLLSQWKTESDRVAVPDLQKWQWFPLCTPQQTVIPGANCGRTTSPTGTPVMPTTHNALPCNRGPTTHYHRHAENTVNSAKASQTVGGASSDNKQHGYSHYSAECSASNGNTHQHDTVPYSRNELFDASTERDDASHRGEDEDEARHRTGHRDYVVNNELNNSLCIQHRLLSSHQQQPQWRPSLSQHSRRHKRPSGCCNARQGCWLPVWACVEHWQSSSWSDPMTSSVRTSKIFLWTLQDSLLDLNQVSMVTWGTAFEDPQMIGDDVSLQGNNDTTPEVPPTTSEIQQPHNKAATVQ